MRYVTIRRESFAIELGKRLAAMPGLYPLRRYVPSKANKAHIDGRVLYVTATSNERLNFEKKSGVAIQSEDAKF